MTLSAAMRTYTSVTWVSKMREAKPGPHSCFRRQRTAPGHRLDLPASAEPRWVAERLLYSSSVWSVLNPRAGSSALGHQASPSS